MNTLGDRLKYLRKLHNIKQQDLSNATNISRSNISKIENNSLSPTATAIIALSNFFRVSTDWLLIGKEDTFNKAKEGSAEYFIENYTIDGKPADPSNIFNPQRKTLLKQIWETFVTLIKEESNVNMNKNTPDQTYGVFAIKNDFPDLYKEIKAIKELGAVDNIYIKEIVELLKELPPSELKEIKNYVNYRLQSYNEANKKGESSTFTHGEETATLDDATA
ncbi:helix-turn-helix domain-containing protein [Maledivibacter halophilus]|uniref:Transcriptional regulator, contains XRE-family HTH domain n=1 Tax=Maledivibacter halophilus TaxID=36842 RepID=A0A1T5L6E4_9FIRM|nr:helix-turn-helix transcriptional regulator [Maledivibacter halophilus]SKC68638.1 Transcriptional regulator, contains XRE-family HTH domain [Maledivibacter halophilus]SKC71531.1 Transcriptional regulator, contains XRE-family HTH domain [Maledivibacter halophilus]SKC80281.1 Transcriptional regulator, contains XRE-family HTH domain [Maledivibacter halophilus]